MIDCKSLIAAVLCVFLLNCEQSSNDKGTSNLETQDLQIEKFTNVLESHLKAVEGRDIETLASTLSPDGEMWLILPQSEITKTDSAFMNFHKAWFLDDQWTLSSEIISVDVGEKRGIGIVKQTYREPERDGKPYYNNMVVSYGLKKVEGDWYVYKDHMCSIGKSTDQE